LPSGGGLTKPSPGVPSGAPIGLGGGSLSLTGAGVLVPGLTLTGDALL
jgi:hypothetical protein